MMAPGERLAKLADLLGECPPPDMAGGYDQCAHGTWPCAITQAAWLAQGRDRDQEVRAACQAAAREMQIEEAWSAVLRPGFDALLDCQGGDNQADSSRTKAAHHADAPNAVSDPASRSRAKGHSRHERAKRPPPGTHTRDQAPEYVIETWVSERLRDRIQCNGTSLAEVLQATDTQKRPPEAELEAEP